MYLDMEGFCVSTGAACSSGSQEPSPALRAMGLSREEAQSSLRVSLGWETTKEDLELFIETLVQVVDRIRKIKNSEVNREIPSPAL
jgi:cysteine desulfurase